MINITLTGLNGYGEHFIPSLLEGKENRYRLDSVVSRNPEKSRYYTMLMEHGVKLYASLEECLKEREIQLVLITTPVHIHYSEVMTALKYGANVYCEKPLAPTIDECQKIKTLAQEKKKLVAVGFQWSYSKAIRELKQDLINKRYGKIKRIKTLVLWNRPKSYFEGSNWKGKMQLEDGQYILESVMSNGAAHFLHNLFFLAGAEMNKSAYPVMLEGEGYRAHHVEGYDTTCVRMMTEEEVELLYYATIVSDSQKTPIFEIELEDAVVRYPVGEAQTIEAETKSGETIQYGSPEQGRFIHYQEVVNAIKTQEEIICDAETVLPEVIAVNAMAEVVPVNQFAENMIQETDTTVCVSGINEMLIKCFEQNVLPSEGDLTFSKGAYKMETREYRHFKGLYKEKRNNLEN